MAIEINFWEPDGPNGESCQRTIRVGKVSEINVEDLVSGRPRGCVRITKDRSDKQSPISHDLWVKPGYKDPFMNTTSLTNFVTDAIKEFEQQKLWAEYYEWLRHNWMHTPEDLDNFVAEGIRKELEKQGDQ